MERPRFTEPQNALIAEYDGNLADQIGLVWGFVETLTAQGVPLAHTYLPDSAKYIPYNPSDARYDARLKSRVPYMPIAAFQESAVITLNSYLNAYFRLAYDNDLSIAPQATNQYNMTRSLNKLVHSEDTRRYVEETKEKLHIFGIRHRNLVRQLRMAGAPRTGTQLAVPNPAQTISDGLGSAVTSTAHLTAIYGPNGPKETRLTARSDGQQILHLESILGMSTIIGEDPFKPNSIGPAIGEDRIDRDSLRAIRSTTGGCPAGWRTPEYAGSDWYGNTVLLGFTNRVAELYEATVAPWFDELPDSAKQGISASELKVLERGAQTRMLQ